MENSDDKRKTYETTPVRMWIPGAPIPSPEELSGKRGPINGQRPLAMTGMTTELTSLAHASIETARLLEHYRKKVKRDFWSVLELLSIQPEFIRIGWVAKAFERSMKLARAKRKRGRPKGTHKVDPAVVLGSIRALQASGRAKTEHQAVLLLFRRGIFTYHQALHGLRAAKKEPKLRPLWLPPVTQAAISAEEAAELLRTAVSFQPGQVLELQLEPGVARLVKVTTEDGQERPYSSPPPPQA